MKVRNCISKANRCTIDIIVGCPNLILNTLDPLVSTFMITNVYSHISNMKNTKNAVSGKSLMIITAFSIAIYLMDIFQCIGTFI